MDSEEVDVAEQSQPQPKRKGGGPQPGSGRPAIRGKTTVKRIPVAYEAAIQALIDHLDRTKDINHHYAPVESEPLFVRSLRDKGQWLTFKTRPHDFRAKKSTSPTELAQSMLPDSGTIDDPIE